MIKRIFVIFIFTLFINNSYAKDNIMILKLKDGDVLIELFEKIIKDKNLSIYIF